MKRVIEGRVVIDRDDPQQGDLRIMNDDGSTYKSDKMTGYSVLDGFKGRNVRITVEDIEEPVVAIQKCIYRKGIQFDVVLMDSSRRVLVAKPVWRDWDKESVPPYVQDLADRLGKFLGLKVVRLNDFIMTHVVLADDYKYFMDVDYVKKEGI